MKGNNFHSLTSIWPGAHPACSEQKALYPIAKTPNTTTHLATSCSDYKWLNSTPCQAVQQIAGPSRGQGALFKIFTWKLSFNLNIQWFTLKKTSCQWQCFAYMLVRTGCYFLLGKSCSPVPQRLRPWREPTTYPPNDEGSSSTSVPSSWPWCIGCIGSHSAGIPSPDPMDPGAGMQRKLLLWILPCFQTFCRGRAGRRIVELLLFPATQSPTLEVMDYRRISKAARSIPNTLCTLDFPSHENGALAA